MYEVGTLTVTKKSREVKRIIWARFHDSMVRLTGRTCRECDTEVFVCRSPMLKLGKLRDRYLVRISTCLIRTWYLHSGPSRAIPPSTRYAHDDPVRPSSSALGGNRMTIDRRHKPLHSCWIPCSCPWSLWPLFIFSLHCGCSLCTTFLLLPLLRLRQRQIPTTHTSLQTGYRGGADAARVGAVAASPRNCKVIN